MELVENEGYVFHADVQVIYDLSIGCNICSEDCGIVWESHDACVVGMVDGYDDVACARQSVGK